MAEFIQATTDANSEWFADNVRYETLQEKLEGYRRIRQIVEQEIKGAQRLLDIGNGGFFNYNTLLARSVTAIDLFVKEGAGPTPNSTMRPGSFLDLPCADGEFDVVMEQNVLHHVTGNSVDENHRNLRRCLAEMYRSLAPGGKGVIIESTVNRVFHACECLAYRPLLFAKRGGHPVTFQYTAAHVADAAVVAGFRIEELTWIPRGMWILQFGYLWPSALTPARPIKLIVRKPALG